MTYRIIGNMTGNSMDAVDLVLTEFDGDKMCDICSYSKPYSKKMQAKMEGLRTKVKDKTKTQILALPEFKSIHDEYIKSVADSVNTMCQKFKIDKENIDAIGFHGKTLDHNPPNKAKVDGTSPYTLQIGSGQMLANLTGIPVVYDFRSAPLMAGFDGAPLVSPHNAHVAATEGYGCYYNGGNTSNFAWVINGKAQVGADAGPFNEYVDNFIRDNTPDSFDKNGKYGLKGKLNKKLLQKLFDIGREYYERALPKSGDPQYYYKDKVFKEIQKSKISLNDAVHTLEYFAAYVAVQALTLIDKKLKLPSHFILFGGGWKNPVVRQSFENLIAGNDYILPEHKIQFETLFKRFKAKPNIKYSVFGEMMEARLFADLARYKLENKPWEIPEIVRAGKKIVCGVIAKANRQKIFHDEINLAAKGWQKEENKMKPILSAFVCLKGTKLTKAEANLLRKYNPAGLTLFKRNIETPEQVKKLTDDIRNAVGRDDFLIAIDQEGGLVRRLRPPYWHEYVAQQQLGTLPEKKAEEAIRLHAILIANDLRELGINVVFAPVADTLHTDTTGAIASRCFSDDPKVVAKYASILAKTYIEQGICPCMKHLPGHGLANTDSHLGLPVIDADWKKIERDFLPFQKMSKFIPFGMTAHVVLSKVDKKPITQSKRGIDLIRGEIGFDGLLITDAIEMKALKGTLAQKTKSSLKAECDVVCYCSGHDQNNPTMVEDCEAVLKASKALSDKALERFKQVLKVVNTSPKKQNISALQKRYDALTMPAKKVKLKGPDHTENWSDRTK